MMKRLFIDSNVIMDLVYLRPECISEEQKILLMAMHGSASLFVSALTFINTVYCSKQYGIKTSEIRLILLGLSQYLDVVDLRGRDVVTMLDSDWKDYEDSVQFKSAQNCGADYIITRNKKHFISSTIPVMTPVEFCDMIDQES